MFYPTLDVTGVEPLDLLVVASHPGDAEWFCGGTMAKVAGSGKRVGILDLSTGDMSARGIPQQRVQEGDAAAALLGLAWRGNLGLPDGRLENNILARMTLAGIVRSLQPKVVIGPHPKRAYPDHRYTAEMLQDACQAAGWPKLDDDLAPHRTTLLLQGVPDLPLPPAVLVPLSDAELELKIRALLCHESQRRAGVAASDPLPFDSETAVRARVTALAGTYGVSAGLAFAEPFYSESPIVLNDLGWLR